MRTAAITGENHATGERRSFRSLLLGRAATCVAILASIASVASVLSRSAPADPGAALRPLVGLMVVSLALTLPYQALGRRQPQRLRQIGLLVVIVDTILLTLGEYLLGGANALFGLPLYGILIVMAATLHSPRAAHGVALLGAGSFAAMVAATRTGWIPEWPQPYALVDNWATSAVLINGFLAAAMAMVAGMLAGLKDDALARSRRAERELRELNADLEERIERAVAGERAARQSLERQNADLSATLRQVNLFAGAVSHDLRNPVTAASEALRLSRRPDTTDRERMLDLAAENLDRADQMVVGLRDLMRAVGSRAANRRVAVRPLLERIVEDLRVQNVGGDVPVELVGDLGEVEADAEHLAHVFRNLIANALAHSEGQSDLHVTVSHTSQREGSTFCVRDNGSGIPEEMRARIFEPFHRGRPGSSGLGLGLALVAAIVTRVGGTIGVETAPGGGAEFRFTWPNRPRERDNGSSSD
jgi:signal transduction histidine kinase